MWVCLCMPQSVNQFSQKSGKDIWLVIGAGTAGDPVFVYLSSAGKGLGRSKLVSRAG